MSSSWYNSWFNEDYLNLYSYHNFEEAEKEVNFVFEYLKLKQKNTVLDLGCGVGRHSLALAKKGLDVTGLDLSKHFIQKALELKHEFRDLKMNFVIGDMKDLSRLGIFDVIVNFFTSFGYFSDEENQQVLYQIVQHLGEEGKFFLDYLNPWQVKKSLVRQEVKIVQGQKIEIYREIKDNCVIKTIQFPNKTYHEEVKLYTSDQIIRMLEKVGLKVEQSWGDYDAKPLTQESSRQLFAARQA